MPDNLWRPRCLWDLTNQWKRLCERITICFLQNTSLISELNPFTVLFCFFLSVIIPHEHFWLRQHRFIRGDLIRLKTCHGLTEHPFFPVFFGKITMYSPKSGPTQRHMKTKASSAFQLNLKHAG